MKKIRKQLLAVLMVLTCLLQLGVVPYASADKIAQEEDCYEITLLRNLGFVDETYGPQSGDEIVTRGQFASIFAYLRGFEGSFITNDVRFIDIPKDYWCAGQIYALYNEGLIHGVSEDRFAPNDYITYPQALKLLVSLLGYDVQAMQLGGYPDGYTKVAAQIGLGASLAEGAIDFKTLAKLIVRAMDTDMLERKFSSGKDPIYSVAKDQTPLKKYNDIYYNIGIMTDNGISSIGGNSKIKNGRVTINNTTMDIGGCDVEQYLGYKLKYYYKNDNGNLTLLFVIPTGTEVVELSDDELDIYNSQFSTKRIYYKDKKNNSYYKIDDYADVIYNGKAYPAFDVDTLKIIQGNLKLVDNDQDGDYDIIFVDKYYNVYVSGIDIDKEVIYGKYGNSIDYGTYSIVEFCAKDGTAVNVNAINEKSVLSVFESSDHEYIKIVVCTGGETGKVESVEKGVEKIAGMTASEIEKFKIEARDMRIIVNEKEYQLSLEYINAVAAGYQGASMPKLNLTYSFHLDMNGKIAGMDNPTGKQYAYLISASYMHHGDMADMIKTKVFLEDGSLITTVFAKNVTVNGIKYKGQDDGEDSVIKLPLFRDEDGGFLHQPVRLRLNNLGEITEIETASPVESSYGYDRNKFTQCFTGNKEYGGHGQRTFNGAYTLASDVVIFNVPPATDFDANELKVIPESTLMEGSTYPVTLYDADASWSCKFAVIQAGESTDWYTAACVIESIKVQVNEDDEPVRVLSGLESINWVNYVEDKPGLFDGLQVGDIVRVVRGVGNKAINVQLLVSPSERGMEPFYDSLDGDDWSTYYGQLYARSDTGFTLTLDHGKSIEAMPFNGFAVNVFDMQTKKARRGSHSDMVMNCPIMDDGRIDLTNCHSMIYVFKRRGYARDIIVVNF